MAIHEGYSVPRLDYSLFSAEDEGQRRRACTQLLQAFSEYGFVKLIHHGIGEGKIRDMFEWNRRFFALDLDIKDKAAHPPQPNPHRGYSFVGQEKLSMVKDYEKGTKNAEVIHDIKESYDQGSPTDTLYPNVWVPEDDLPGFRCFMESVYYEMQAMHIGILHALEHSLELPQGFFEKLCNDNTSELRLNHYPACSAKDLTEGVNRISEHTDFGTITILFQDSVGGLEVEDQRRYGSFIPVLNDDPNEVIINIGDCMQRWTNGKLRSANHRVKLPPSLKGQGGASHVEDRYSIAYFAKPNRSQTVGTLKPFVAPGSDKYEDMTAWEYNQAKLTRTY